MVNKLTDQYSSPLDLYLCNFIDTHLHTYRELELTPNMVTTIGFLMGLLSAYYIIKGRVLVAAIAWILSYYFDCVDGKLARKYDMVTKFGDYYDHICDAIKSCLTQLDFNE